MTPRRAPAGLGDRGRRFWRTIAGDYDLRVDEYELLKEACRAIDTIDALTRHLDDPGELVTSPTGQVRIDPRLVEVRQQQLVLARLCSQLGLPDDVDEPARTPARVRAQKAARSRWGALRVHDGA